MKPLPRVRSFGAGFRGAGRAVSRKTSKSQKMGYTHYWYRPRKIEKGKFARFAEDALRIVQYSEALGIRIGDWEGKHSPTINTETVEFNGHEKQPNNVWTTNEEITIPWPSDTAGIDDPDPDPITPKKVGTWFAGDLLNTRTAPLKADGYGSGSYESFVMPRIVSENPPGDHLDFGFCKTAYRPYDLTVTAVLIAAKHHFGCVVKSDGDQKDWIDGAVLCNNLFGYGLNFTLDD